MALNYIKELLTTGLATEGQLLTVRKIHDVLISETEKALIPRSEAAFVVGPSGCPGQSYDVDLETPNTLKVRTLGEGADIDIDNNDYTTTNIKPLKYGVGIRITREMLEDAKWNLLERNIRLAGKRLAENENNLVILQLDSAGNTVSGGASLTIANITEGMMNLENSDYSPTTLFVGIECLNDLRNIDTFVEADKKGDTEMLDTGFVGRIYGMNVIKFSTKAAPSTTYAKYAYVTDKTEAYCIVEKRPVTVERFELPSNDMSAAVVTQRIAVKILRTSAVSNITTS